MNHVGFLYGRLTTKSLHATQTALQRLSPAYYFLQRSHCWFTMLQDVLLADWQEVWHSPQPPFNADFAKSLVAMVLILFICTISFNGTQAKRAAPDS
jgi:hypothetical protein